MKRLGIELAKHPAEGVMAGSAVLQAEKLAQERPFRAAERLHVGTVLAATQQGAKGDEQNFVKIVADVVLPRVRDLGKSGDERFHKGGPRVNPNVGIQSGTAPLALNRGKPPYANPLIHQPTPVDNTPYRRSSCPYIRPIVDNRRLRDM